MATSARRPAMSAPGAAGAGVERVRVRVEGTVQGVGFRPFVHRLAGELGLTGFVLNDERGVEVEAEGPAGALATLAEQLVSRAPPMARVEAVAVERIEPTGAESGFAIAASSDGGEARAPIAADAATCAECLEEIADPTARRYRYPFTNCTNCGPRFTIIRSVPYDRPQTTMAAFEMCGACRAEYEDHGDRRFHAQPIACPDCGPTVRLIDSSGAAAEPRAGEDAIGAAARELAAGRIVAVKGLGGYHLACRADDEDAVASLRARKRRDDKPFALMVAGLDGARRLVSLTAAEEALLAGPERPIVIARARPGADVAPSVAPRCRDLGLMLPYTPLHHLLLADLEAATADGGPAPPLVMTSGNVSDEPIAYEDGDALERLGELADLLLVHDREIHIRTDDSVLRALDPGLRPAPLLIRRSRGYVPRSIALPAPARAPVLGVGAELKSTFCLAKGERAWVGHHIGDLKNWETLSSFRDGVAHFERAFEAAPRVVAHDMHPDYMSTGYALARDGVEHVAVQHHHAHLAACLAEHRIEGAAIGAIFDGSGFGGDQSVWGGELLVGDVAASERVGTLFPIRLAGGDAAVREPWRCACAWLGAAYETELPERYGTLPEEVSDRVWSDVCELIRSGLNSPLTTSVGRLFDAVAAICGLRARVNHEGQAAMELEALSDPRERGAYHFGLLGSGPLVIDPRPAIRAIADELGDGVPVRLVGARFHNGLAAVTAEACAIEAERRGGSRVVLSGGVFQNRLLLERTAAALGERALEVLLPEQLPPNDGGISFGQVAATVARIERGEVL